MTAEVRMQVMRRNATIEEAPLQGELMLFDPENSRFFVLNDTMAFVWNSCDGTLTLEQVAAKMVDAYAGIEFDQAILDVGAAASSLRDQGLCLFD